MRMPLHCHYEYNGDGRFPHPRIKGWDKHYLGKWRRRMNKKELEREIELNNVLVPPNQSNLAADESVSANFLGV